MIVQLAELFALISRQKRRSGFLAPTDFLRTLRERNELFRGNMQQVMIQHRDEVSLPRGPDDRSGLKDEAVCRREAICRSRVSSVLVRCVVIHPVHSKRGNHTNPRVGSLRSHDVLNVSATL